MKHEDWKSVLLGGAHPVLSKGVEDKIHKKQMTINRLYDHFMEWMSLNHSDVKLSEHQLLMAKSMFGVCVYFHSGLRTGRTFVLRFIFEFMRSQYGGSMVDVNHQLKDFFTTRRKDENNRD